MTELSLSEIKTRLQQMGPYQFEKLVAEVWETQGFQTNVRKGSGDRGIDVEAQKSTPFDQRVLIQAKRYTGDNKLGSKDVREYATLYQQVDNVDTVAIVTTGDVTREAEILASDLNVKIVDGYDIAEMVAESSEDIDNFNPNSEFNPAHKNIKDTGTPDNEEPVTSHPFDMGPSMTEPITDHEHKQKCSICGSKNSIWYSKKQSNDEELLKCSSCGTLWGREQKGLIFKSKGDWEIYSKGK
jgi:DNA-directed RNA polymerase subunit M/transcription elongation factor TFIIS